MARDFDGVDDLISVPSDVIFDVSEFSIGFWTKVDDLAGGGKSFFNRRPTTNDAGWTVDDGGTAAPSNIRFFVHIGAGFQSAISSGGLITGTWMHIAATYSQINERLTVYKDGVQVAQTTGATGVHNKPTGEPLVFGQNIVTGKTLDGKLAESTFFSKELSASEIKALVRSAHLGNRIGYWTFWGIASPEGDLSGNGNNGTVTGAVRADHAPVGRYVSAPKYFYITHSLPQADFDGAFPTMLDVFKLPISPGLFSIENLGGDPEATFNFPIMLSLFGLPLSPAAIPLKQSFGTTCPAAGEVGPQGIFTTLPRAAKDTDREEFEQIFNEAMGKLEHYMNRLMADPPCKVCPVNGEVTLDLGQCSHFEVDADQDIGKINVLRGSPGQKWDACFLANCAKGHAGKVNISGWPAETFQTEQRTSLECGQSFCPPFIVDLGFRSKPWGPLKAIPGGGGGGGAGGPGGCACDPDLDPETGTPLLTVSCCSQDCELDCKDKKAIELVACGGVGPYTWQTTKGSLSVTGGLNERARLAAKPNNPNVAGVAYKLLAHKKGNVGGGSCADIISSSCAHVGCDDLLEADLAGGGCTNTSCTECASCGPCFCCDQGALGGCEFDCTATGLSSTNQIAHPGANCIADVRTQQMKDDGCEPCVLMDGAVVTVTDAVGTAVATVIGIKP